MTPRLTVTYGLRWVLEAPPYETNGLQVAPCVEAASGGCTNQNVTDYFNHSAQLAAQGMPANNAGEITFVPGGPVNKGPGLWNWDRKNRGGPDGWRSLHPTRKNQKIPKMLAPFARWLGFRRAAAAGLEQKLQAEQCWVQATNEHHSRR
jgi:hypothetical protein